MSQDIPFQDEKHKHYFQELTEQGQGELTSKQRAFAYLIAMYQEDYKAYEGLPFYIEVYEEVSLDGPVYLLEDCMSLQDYPHERALGYGKMILKGEDIPLADVEAEMREWVAIAKGLSEID